MKIVVAPDSFKGSSSSIEVCRALSSGLRRILPSAGIVGIPVADGGEGTVDAVITAAGGEKISTTVTGPAGNPVKASFGVLPNDRAVIEMAAASGLTLVPPGKRNPLVTTTFGTGELIKAALDSGSREILIGIGGSATNDAGIGMAQALGVSFRDEAGREAGFGGGELAKIERIDLSGADPRLRECRITIACDVTNPLYGPDGAACVYAKQKGATPGMIRILDDGLRHFASVLHSALQRDISAIPGTGAAGGLGAGLVAFCGGVLSSGIDAVLDLVRFDSYLAGTDLVITGEGRLDGQSLFGKVPVGVARRAKRHGIPVVAIVGDIGPNFENVYSAGISAVVSTVNRAMPLREAIRESLPLLEETAERVARLLSIGMNFKRNDES